MLQLYNKVVCVSILTFKTKSELNFVQNITYCEH